ncbi:MAG: c-type cytochrome [Chromatiales bacterium]|nr:c-type cytochrome [Chromatiales bacterium]
MTTEAGYRTIATLFCASLLCTGAYAQEPAPDDALDHKALSETMLTVNANPETRAKALRSGHDRAALCAGCHGDTGIGTREWIPNLAGQNLQYVLDQVIAYANRDRQDRIMNTLAERFSDEDIVNLSVYYHNMTPETFEGPAPDSPTIKQGESLYQRACKLCHGDDGRGAKGYSWLAGQKPEYLRRALKRYRAGEGGRIDPKMAAYTAKLTDEEIDALAAYVSTMR